MAERFNRFTEGARRVFQLAQNEAQRLHHDYIGTEHLLYGLLHEPEGVAARALASLGVELPQVETAVELIGARGEQAEDGGPGLTPRAKKIIELSVEEARRMNHNYIGTEHLLLGLVREGEGVAAGVLHSLGVSLEKVREQVNELHSQLAATESTGGLPEAVSRVFRAPRRRRSAQSPQRSVDPWRAFRAEPNVTGMEALLADLDRVNDEIGYRRCAAGPGYECGLVRFLPRTERPGRQIAHPDKDVVCHVISGRGTLHLGAEVRDVAPGDICHIPARTSHDFVAAAEPLVLFYASVVVPEPLG